jgi:hypothetical protein
VGCLWSALFTHTSLHADNPVDGGIHEAVSCTPTAQVEAYVPAAVSPLRLVPAARSIYSLTGSSKQYRQRPLSAFQCTIASFKKPESTLSERHKPSRVGFVLMVPLLVLAVSLHGWVQLRRSRLRNPVTPFFQKTGVLESFLEELAPGRWPLTLCQPRQPCCMPGTCLHV